MRILVVLFLLIYSSNGLAIDSEISLAKEAAPMHITKDASYMSWSEDKFVKVVEGTNSFTCLVVRDDKGRFEPSCFNRQALKSILPVYEYLTNMLIKCMDIKSIYKNIEAKAKKGEFLKPEVGSVVYMMSKRNKFYDHFSGKLMDIPPHIMLYSEKLEGDVLGFNGQNGLPMFYNEFPHLSVIHINTGNN